MSITEQELQAIAAKYGTTGKGTQSSLSSRIPKTYLCAPKDIRTVLSSWMEGAQPTFTITAKDQDKSNGEPFLEDFVFNTIKGFVVHVEIQPSLSIKGEGDTQVKTLCSVTGYRDAETNKLIQALPSDAIKTMYAWDTTKGGYSNDIPAPIVEKLGLVGNRGQSCAECIRQGKSIIQDDKGKIITCGPYGRAIFAVYEVSRVKKDGTEITKTISELSEGEMDMFLLSFNLPGKIAIKGYFDKDLDKCRNSYAPYVLDLARRYPDSLQRDIKFVGTKLSIQPPVPGKPNTKNFLVFTEMPTDIRKLDQAQTLWEQLKVEQNFHHLDNPPELDPVMFGLDKDFNPIKSSSNYSNDLYQAPEDSYENDINPFSED